MRLLGVCITRVKLLAKIVIGCGLVGLGYALSKVPLPKPEDRFSPKYRDKLKAEIAKAGYSPGQTYVVKIKGGLNPQAVQERRAALNSDHISFSLWVKENGVWSQQKVELPGDIFLKTWQRISAVDYLAEQEKFLGSSRS